MNPSNFVSREAGLVGVPLVAACLVGVLAASNGAAVLALPLLLAAGLILFARPILGLLLLTAMIPLEAGLMIGGRSAAALIGMAVFGVWAAQKLLRREALLPLASSAFVRLALVFVALACMSILWAQSPQSSQWRILLLVQLLLLSVLVIDLTSSWERAAWVAKALVLAGLVASLLTVEQYFVGGVRRAGGGVAGGINRTAATLVTILPFAFFLWRSREHTLWRFVGLAYIALSALAVSATLSRSSFLLFPLVVGIQLTLMARTRGERQRVLLLGIIAVIVLSFIPMDAVRHRAETILPFMARTVGVEQISEEEEYRAAYTARSFFIRMGLEMFKDRPLLGSGYGNYQAQTELYQWRVPRSPYEWVRSGRSPHSSHVAVLVGLGIVGFGMWIGLFVIALLYAWRAWWEGEIPTSTRVLLGQAVGIAVALQLFYGFSMEIDQDKIVWLTLGFAVAIHRLSKEESSELGQARSRMRVPAK